MRIGNFQVQALSNHSRLTGRIDDNFGFDVPTFRVSLPAQLNVHSSRLLLPVVIAFEVDIENMGFCFERHSFINRVFQK